MRMKEVRAEIERLKQTRQLSYLKIGQGIGYTDNGVWNFMKGPNKLSIDNADKILNLFGKELMIVERSSIGGKGGKSSVESRKD